MISSCVCSFCSPTPRIALERHRQSPSPSECAPLLPPLLCAPILCLSPRLSKAASKEIVWNVEVLGQPKKSMWWAAGERRGQKASTTTVRNAEENRGDANGVGLVGVGLGVLAGLSSSNSF